MQTLTTAGGPAGFMPTGQVLGHYTRPTTAARIGLIFWGALFLIALLLLAFVPDTTTIPQSDARYWLISGTELAGLFFGPIGFLYCAFVLFVIGSYNLDLYEDGIIIERNGVRGAYPWSALLQYNIQSTKMSINFIPAGTTHSIRLRMADGKTFRLDSGVKRVTELIELLPRLTYPALLNRTLSQLAAGQSVAFGAISATPLGLTSGNRQVAWTSIADVTLDHGELAVWVNPPPGGKRPQVFKRIPFGETPNAFVLIGLIRRNRQQASSSAQAAGSPRFGF